MATQPAPNESSPNNQSNQDQANPLHPPPTSNPGTANSGGNSASTPATTPAPPQFNLAECSKYLSSRNTAAMEALSSKKTISNEKPELYKPPGPSSLAGGWGSGKYTSMANGADFLTSLFAKIDQQQHQQQHHQQQQQHPQQHPHHHHHQQQHQHKLIQPSNHHPHHYPNHPQKPPHQH